MTTTVNQSKSSSAISSVDDETINGYIVLNSIDPNINRFRAYSISITTIQTQETLYMVRNQWGRISNLYQSNTRLFKDIEVAKRYIRTTLLVQKRHGYFISEKSNGFPSIELLHEFSSVPTFKTSFLAQLSLFQRL